MTHYSNKGRDSGISAYEIKDDGIIVQFSSGVKYLYTYASAGSAKIEKMKELALIGEGLNSFIIKNTRTSYASKLS